MSRAFRDSDMSSVRAIVPKRVVGIFQTSYHRYRMSLPAEVECKASYVTLGDFSPSMPHSFDSYCVGAIRLAAASMTPPLMLPY